MPLKNDEALSEQSNGQTSRDSIMSHPGSDAADKDADADNATPYGTRSRNRTGNARPNYAEDKDIDMDVYDYYHDKKEGEPAPKKSSRQSTGAAGNEAPRGSAASRKSGVDDAKTSSSQNGAKEQSLSSVGSGNGGGNGGGGGGAAGSTSQAAQSSGAVQPSRKRKAASQQNSGPTTTTRKGGNANANATASTAGAQGLGQSQSQTTGIVWPESNMLTFETCKARPDKGRMVADDGTVLEANDHVYLVCEPPGEPYYLGRIMEFLHMQNDNSRPVDAVRINWYYRPKDIGRKSPDTRMVFATMHSDISPLTALRGKCQIRHRVEIDNMDEFRKTPDSFWYEKLYDRYIQKNYDLIPTSAIVNVPEKVKKVLDERWRYVLVEQGRGKELTSAVKLCKRCSGYCAINDSVDCAVCRNTYHMNCVKPPLLKKPSRGFAWSCAACSRAQERKLEARHTPNISDKLGDHLDEDDFLEEDEDDGQAVDTGHTSPAEDDTAHHQGTAEQIYHASLWPYRYLGVHCKPEDALDYDDRIYPRASTRIGPRHQAIVLPWPGQPVQYVKPLEVKKNGKKDPKLSKEAQAAQEAEKALRGKRPKWVQDQPPGYVARGEDHDESDPNATSTLLWKPQPPEVISAERIKGYMTEAKGLAKKLSLPERSTNLQDVALETLFRSNCEPKVAISSLRETDRIEFKEPALMPAEVKKFEEGVSKYGSELLLVTRHVKTLTPGEVVRYYYTWKKTERGQQIWGNYSGRKGKKAAKRAEAAATKVADDVADKDDDSAFDVEKAAEKKRGFICQFCSTTTSRQWRRAPNAAAGLVNEAGNKANNKDKGGQYVSALCRRCAELWRRYAIRWEDIEDVAKKVAQSGGKAWKRRQDEELLKELQAAQEMGLMTPDRASTPSVAAVSTTPAEPPRKKLKGAPEKDTESAPADGGSAPVAAAPSKKKEKNVDAAPAVPEIPKPRTLPCAICDQMEPLGDQHVSCRECRLTVHRNCYGVVDQRPQAKWICNMCANDKNPQVSLNYRCVLCPVEHTERDFVEQPKLTHHKKKMTEKDREREKLEVQQARKAAEFYRKKQEELNRPVDPREPLKRTADHNWVHVTCAAWTPEVKFGNAKAMEPSEGIPSIPRARYDEVCQVCQKTEGACVSCQQCRTSYHVECARQHGHVLGFEITPVKNSRRDQFNTVTLNGESGIMSAAVWCKDHVPAKTTVHRMHDAVDDSGLNALQLYVQNFKQADLALTGTVRKANLMTMAAKMSTAPVSAGGTKSATSTATSNAASQSSTNGHTAGAGEYNGVASSTKQPGDKVCITCGIDVSPKWWPIDNSQERELTNGHYGVLGSEARKFVEQRKFQCHQCRKANRAPQPHPHRSWASVTESPRAVTNEPVVATTGPPPPISTLPPLADFRERSSSITSNGWSHHGPPNGTAGVQPPLTAAPTQAGPQNIAARPAPPVAHTYTAAPLPASRAYSDWNHRPSSQHGSPPRLLNGPPPSLRNGNAGLSTISGLRPPSMSGPPPAVPGPLVGAHQHPHSPQTYVNGPPPSPRRVGGPTPPSPYMPPYHSGQPHGPPSNTAAHAMNNGIPPPRADGFSHGLHPQRPAFSNGHGSPPQGARNGAPPPLELSIPTNSVPPRAPEGRPASGASASPSLRNLLS
ncbi:hypothetical protein B0I35DRAFT_419940 [Stachybotrys elegans]|uniref:Uncharacterized protein n=1 Tax=Stachybotrys elegans TaxID=80388 RepID=A0A8K0T8U7_9HYPO|nr:hypothetical protein B0I35DRAFT_419940 [Stachybotrys elegans]